MIHLIYQIYTREIFHLLINCFDREILQRLKIISCEKNSRRYIYFAFCGNRCSIEQIITNEYSEISSVNAVKCYEYCSFTEIYAQIYRDRLPNETIYNPLLKILELYCHKFDMSGVFIRVKLSLSLLLSIRLERHANSSLPSKLRDFDSVITTAWLIFKSCAQIILERTSELLFKFMYLYQNMSFWPLFLCNTVYVYWWY